MSNKDWWKPKNLKESEKKILSAKNIDSIDTRNDFGSYKIMRLKDDISASQLNEHNDIDPIYRVMLFKKVLKRKSLSSILDIGCGAGFTTNELKNAYQNASVTGMDISEDAIAYAQKKFNKCNFICDAIDPTNNNQVLDFELITAFEFYPFTRTDSFKDHADYITHLTKNLRKGGKLAIVQLWDNPLSISTNYNAIKDHFKNLNFETYTIPIKKIGIYIKSRLLAVALSELIRFIQILIKSRKIGKKKIIIITKK